MLGQKADILDRKPHIGMIVGVNRFPAELPTHLEPIFGRLAASFSRAYPLGLGTTLSWPTQPSATALILAPA